MRKGSRFSALRKKESRRLAVASTVGTIMSLLVFLAFLSLFTTQYIPVWMTENEAQHGDEVLTQMASVRQNSDLLILSGDRDTEAFAAVKLGASGVPVFAAPTAGILSLNAREDFGGLPDQARADANLIVALYNDSGTGTGIQKVSSGRLQLYMPNRYFIQQWYSLENGAIVLNQSDGEWMRVGPHMRVERSGNTLVNMSFRILSFVGKTQNLIGTHAVGVTQKLMNVIEPDAQFYGASGCVADPTVAVSPRTVTLTLYSNYAKAWSRWFDSAFKSAGLSNTNRTVGAGCVIPADYTVTQGTLKVTITVRNLSYFSLTEAIFNMRIGEEV